MNTREIANIFDYLNYKRISLEHSVPFCLRLLNKQINEIAEQAGVSRGYFYKSLTGARKINKGIRQELEKLGININ